MALKKTNHDLLVKIFGVTEAQYAKKTDLATLQETVDGIISTGGEANVLEGVKVNGTALTITDKMVDVLIASGATDGTIAVTGTNVAVTGYADLVSTVSGKADAATTLAGYGITDGMTADEIASAIAEAVAGADHLKRVIVSSTADIDLTADDADQYIYMVANADGESGNSYDEYMVINGALEKVGDWAVDLSDYAKFTDISVTVTGDGNVVTGVSYDSSTGVFTITKGITALTEDDFEDMTEAEVEAAFEEAEAAAAE